MSHTGAGDLSGEPVGYITGVLAVLVHAAYLVIIQKTSTDSDYGPLTAQYIIAITATPLLIIFSFASMDMINAWSFPGWKDPAMVCTFIACTLIGCAMNFTTLHCTYLNSAVTTSFVGVVKSIATITVGMLAFNDVEPTSLFIAGVVVNTFGSVIYCVAKFFETRRQINYEDLEKDAMEDEKKEQDGQHPPFVMEEILQENSTEAEPQEKPPNETANNYTEEKKNTLASVLQSHGPTEPSDGESRSSLRDAYLGVWRMVRGTRFFKKDYLIENEELPSP